MKNQKNKELQASLQEKYLNKLNESKLLIVKLEELNTKINLSKKEDFKDEDCYINERLCYFIKEEQQKQETFSEQIARNNKYLDQLKHWEINRKI